MKYISLDLETTTISPKIPENILMISMVVEDSKNLVPLEELPHFTRFIRQTEYTGSAYALGMNGWIFDFISGRNKEIPYPIIPLGEFENDLDGIQYYNGLSYLSNKFLDEHFGTENNITLAGKNVGTFDLQFLPFDLQKRFHHRIIDVGNLFIDWNQNELLTLSQIKTKLGFEEIVAHDAYKDALDTIRILRTTY